jgi:AcrR family transcriptional regulator
VPRTPGLRDQKKIQTRHRLADVAASLFATHGYDNVAITDVARAAEVSDQTVYNYFPTKPELVLDRAEEIRQRYGTVVTERPTTSTPAEALTTLVHEDIDRYLHTDLHLARGEFPALCLQSPALRRFALEAREHQTRTISEAIISTHPDLNPLIVHAHAAALVALVQAITDRIGAAVLEGREGSDRARQVRGLRADADAALDDLSQHFLTLVSGTSSGAGRSTP